MHTDRQHQRTAYANLASRLFLKSIFENQWVIPDSPPTFLERFFAWYEKHILNVDISEIIIDRPIFIISLPRCGSSMLQDIICHHPDVAYTTNMMHTFRSCFCAAEHFRRKMGFNVRGERFLKDSVDVDGGSPADPVATWAEWFEQDPYDVKYVELTIERFDQEQVQHIKQAIRKVLWCFKGNSSRFECKTPALLPHAVFLQELFPDAKFIHLVRDARASANSLLKLQRLSNEQLAAIRNRQGRTVPEQPFIAYPRLPKLESYLNEYGPDDIRTTANLWNDGLEFIQKHQHRFTNFYETRYEDILENPREEILRILDFCELSYPEKDNHVFWEKLQQVGVIHHKNTYSDFELVEHICHAQMERFGYLGGSEAS